MGAAQCLLPYIPIILFIIIHLSSFGCDTCICDFLSLLMAVVYEIGMYVYLVWNMVRISLSFYLYRLFVFFFFCFFFFLFFILLFPVLSSMPYIFSLVIRYRRALL